MVRILKPALILLAYCGATTAAASDRHHWALDVTVGVSSASSDFAPWTESGLGKLRNRDGTSFDVTRVFAEYEGRVTPTLRARLVADYVDDASPGVDVTEAYLQWRPIPDSPLRQQWRLGAFYPAFSLENGARGWASPFTSSFSAINTWLGEEIRPIGLEWSSRRILGPAGSPHEVGAFAGAFYGNDPAGTLLFWRGFAIHDRQSRLGDDLPLPPAPVWINGEITNYSEQLLEPYAEIDNRPGYYAGIEWRYAERALVKIARYDNRADPWAFEDGQWGWATAFNHIGTQVELPGDAGLVAQWMTGHTDWLIATTPTGMTTPATELVDDRFESMFLLLTKRLGEVHRLTVRYDDFEYTRAPDSVFDRGKAWTFGYRYDPGGRVAVGVEWSAIDSRRDLWTEFYGAPHEMRERQVRFEVTFRTSARR
jgi:hypothetical protein